MKRPYISVVIGKGFGDEGKGMAVDFLASHHNKVLVVRHNGGAQSGHTVELPDKRFVFHELSSGSFRMADTFWADTFFPDMYKLSEEISEFEEVCKGEKKSVGAKDSGDGQGSLQIPTIYADENAQVTIIDDVLINMAAELARGEERHGSCGMGIYEALCRGKAGYEITIGDLLSLNYEALVNRLEVIRREYLPKRLKELGLDLSGENVKPQVREFGEMLMKPEVIRNAARTMLDNMVYVTPVRNVKELFDSYEEVIFESGQGLLLDTDNEKYSPHVTASKTGLANPCALLKRIGCCLDEVVYVTRSYVTRHGAGPLPNECDKRELGITDEDKTNIDNPWQGSIRYARHEGLEEFAEDIKKDMGGAVAKCMLMITHLDETNGKMMCKDGAVEVAEFCEKLRVRCGDDGEGEQRVFDGYYLSWSRYGDVRRA